MAPLPGIAHFPFSDLAPAPPSILPALMTACAHMHSGRACDVGAAGPTARTVKRMTMAGRPAPPSSSAPFRNSHDHDSYFVAADRQKKNRRVGGGRETNGQRSAQDD
jgi:hypothetical protein